MIPSGPCVTTRGLFGNGWASWRTRNGQHQGGVAVFSLIGFPAALYLSMMRHIP